MTERTVTLIPYTDDMAASWFSTAYDILLDGECIGRVFHRMHWGPMDLGWSAVAWMGMDEPERVSWVASDALTRKAAVAAVVAAHS